MDRRGAAPGERRGGRAKGVPNRNRETVRETLDRLGCNPIEILGMFARRDVVGLGMMTQAELDAPEVWGKDKQGKAYLVKPSGKAIAQRLIDGKLQERAAEEVTQYAIPKLSSVAMTGADGKDLRAGIVVLAPPSGREGKPQDEAEPTEEATPEEDGG